MRRVLLFLLFSFPLAFLSAEAFLSNALGQDLGELETLTGTGYEGERDGGDVTIYLDGEVIRKRIATDDGYIIEYGDTIERVSLNDSGERREWSLSTPEREETHLYYYDEDGSLASVSVTVNGELERRVVYLETPGGRLAGITGSGEAYIFPSFYLYENEGDVIRFTYHPGGPVIREDLSAENPPLYEIEDDGSWKETSLMADGRERVRVYNSSGLLVEESADGSVTEYIYDDEGVLLQKNTVDGSIEINEIYADGHLSSRVEIEDGITQKERHYLATGEIEEIRYRDGKAEYRILFDGDGVRVREIERL